MKQIIYFVTIRKGGFSATRRDQTFLSVCQSRECKEETLQGYRLPTKASVEGRVDILAEQAMDQVLEREQLTVGWEEG